MKLDWKEGAYGSSMAKFGNLIQVSVEWDSTVSKGEPTGYKATVTTGCAKYVKKLLKSREEAQKWCESAVLHMLAENKLKLARKK